MLDLPILWAGFGTETKAAIIGAVATGLTGALGFGAVIFQIGSQGRANRHNIAESERRRLKTELYEQTIAVCAALQDRVITFSNAMRMLGQSVRYAAAAKAGDLPAPLPVQRMQSIMDAHTEMANAVCEFIFMIERRQIVDPRILVFRTGMNVASFDVNELYHHQFVPIAIPLLPADLPTGQVVFNAPEPAAAEAFNQLTTSIADATGAVMTCIEDFLIEMQNLLLGDLFGATAQHRVPIDPAARVIRLDRHEAIEHELSTNTAWGRQAAHWEEQARIAFGVQDAASRNSGVRGLLLRWLKVGA